MTGVEPAEIDSGDPAVAIGPARPGQDFAGGDSWRGYDQKGRLRVLSAHSTAKSCNLNARSHSAPTLPGYPFLPQAAITRQYSSQTGYGGIGLLTQPGLAADTSSLTRPYSYRSRPAATNHAQISVVTIP